MTGTLAEILSGPSLGWLPAVTLVYLLATQPWKVHMPAGSDAQLLATSMVALVTAGIFLSWAAREPLFWLSLTLLHAAWIRSAYHVADNHHYLIAYWSVALTIALWLDPAAGDRAIGESARLLLGVCFVLAALAKIENKAYRNGTFFVWQLVADPRFLPLAILVGGLSPADRERHVASRLRVRNGVSDWEQAPVPPRLRSLAVALTWWTVAIEAFVGILFLLPVPEIAIVRFIALMVFVVTTFSFVAVAAFGQLLLIMLLATTPDPYLRSYGLALACVLSIVSFLPQVGQKLSPLLQRALLVSPRLQGRSSPGPL